MSVLETYTSFEVNMSKKPKEEYRIGLTTISIHDGEIMIKIDGIYHISILSVEEARAYVNAIKELCTIIENTS